MAGAAQSQPFFHLRSTQKLIDELSHVDSLLLYVGAGASIERTGLSWAGLSAQLLDASLGDDNERAQIVDASSPLAVSSAIAEQYRSSRSDGWRERLRAAIADELYRGPSNLVSYVNDRVVSLANQLILAGKTTAIVTPNYDQFLIDAINTIKPEDRKFTDLRIFAFGVDELGEAVTLQPQLDEMIAALKDQSTLCVVYLHGFVGREEPDLEHLRNAHPVVSESDYAVTRENSQTILAALFEDKNALIVGSSITDPPLIHALIKSKNQRNKRYAVTPTHGYGERDAGTTVRSGINKVADQRASHLGLRLVKPPFFYQAPQILEELKVDLFLGKTIAYSDVQATHRYGMRLSKWWNAWFYNNDSGMVERQEDAYEFLRDGALPEVRKILEVPDAESLKLEAWIRWRPEERQLALWASSTGTWPDFETMRKDPLSLDSEFGATHTFLNGAPTYTASTAPTSRWRSYLAKPIRIADEYFSYLPVGVISVASMLEQSESSLNPRIRVASSRLFSYLDNVGSVLFSPQARYSSDD